MHNIPKSFVLDGPELSVDKLYLSHHDKLTMELVCSASSNPESDISWSRLDTATGNWQPVPLQDDNQGDNGVYTVHRQV